MRKNRGIELVIAEEALAMIKASYPNLETSQAIMQFIYVNLGLDIKPQRVKRSPKNGPKGAGGC